MEKLNTINQLLNEIQTISESYKRVAEATGENFNIFSVLQMESDEVKTHSRFLAELLNPKGSHGQKDVFLKKFVERFGIEDFETENAEVFVEFYIGEVTPNSGGRIDILVRNKSDVVMIENKIYANEQPNQLTRYKNYRPKGHLLYLTLDGKVSKDEKVNTNDYRCISYESDILIWLEECKKESVNVPILRETIAQYINLIKTLTGQNINTKMSLEIAKKVVESSSKLDALIDLVNSQKEIRDEIINDIVIKLIEKVAKENHLTCNYQEIETSNNKSIWKSFWFSNTAIERLNLRLCFSLNVESGFRNLIYGFSYKNMELKADLHEYKKIVDGFQEICKTVRTSPHWICYDHYSEEYRNWEKLETLKNIKFGNFKSDFEEKVKSMLAIIDSI